MNYLKEYTSKKQRLYAHLFFWFLIIVFEVSRYQMSFKNYTIETFFDNLIEETTYIIFVVIPAAYFTTYYLIQQLYFKKKYVQFTLLSICSVLFFVYLLRVIAHFIILPNLYPVYFSNNPDFFSFNIVKHVFYIYSAVFMFVMVKLFRQYYQMNQVKEQLKKQNIESELNLLRSQINPHFLFNTLNNINSLVHKNSQLTYLSILKLSDIMRYMLYDSNSNKVSLEKEIDYLKSYIGLQQLRLESDDFVSLSIEGNYKGKFIAPMLFIAFVENAFKYADKNAKAPGIKIDLHINDKMLDFEVFNFKKKISSPDLTNSNGIGIKNVKRRLDLIYPDKHELKILDQKDNFKAKLRIEL